MIRLSDWESRLQVFLSVNAQRKFNYGTWDCALFVAGAIEAMTGTDHGAWFRGKYSNREGARRLMHERSGTANFQRFFEFMADQMRLREVPTSRASRGDMVLTGGGRSSLGIVALDGQHIVLVGETANRCEGLGLVGIDRGERAWRV